MPEISFGLQDIAMMRVVDMVGVPREGTFLPGVDTLLENIVSNEKNMMTYLIYPMTRDSFLEARTDELWFSGYQRLRRGETLLPEGSIPRPTKFGSMLVTNCAAALMELKALHVFDVLAYYAPKKDFLYGLHLKQGADRTSAMAWHLDGVLNRMQQSGRLMAAEKPIYAMSSKDRTSILASAKHLDAAAVTAAPVIGTQLSCALFLSSISGMPIMRGIR